MKTKRLLSYLAASAAMMSVGGVKAQSFEKSIYEPGSDMNHYNVTTTQHGDYVVAGTLFRPGGETDIEVMMLDANGNVMWTKIIDVSDDDRALDVVVDSHNDILITGYVTPTTINYTELYVAKFDYGGTFMQDAQFEGFHAAVGTNIIHSQATDTYIIGGFMSEPLSFPLIGCQARILELDLALGLVNNAEFSAPTLEHASINDIVEVPTGYFITGSVAIDGSTPAGAEGVLAVFVDHGLSLTYDLSFEATNSEHVGVSAVYDPSVDELYLMSNNSVIHNPQISEILDVSGGPFVAYDYYINLDPTLGATNAAGFQLELSLNNPDHLVAAGYFRTSEAGSGTGNDAGAWVVEFKKNIGSQYTGFMYSNISPNFHAHGGGVLSTFSGEHPYIFNQEILTPRPDRRGYALIAPRLIGSDFGFDLIGMPLLNVDYMPCFEWQPYTGVNISSNSINATPDMLAVVGTQPNYGASNYGVEERIFCEEIYGFRREALTTEENITGLEVSIVPNPVSSSFFVEIKNANLENAQIVLQNSLGQTIYSANQIVGNYYSERIDLSDYAEGLYTLRIVNGNSQTVEKIIKL